MNNNGSFNDRKRRFCSNCGTKFEENCDYCSQCGKSIKKESMVSNSQPLNESLKNQNENNCIVEYNSSSISLSKQQFDNAVVIRLMADNLFYGKGIEQDTQKAIRLYLRAASMGDAEAQLYAYLAYEEGFEVEQNFDEAIKWCALAAEQNNGEALCHYGGFYFSGHYGFEQDQKKAVQIWQKGSDLGNNNCSYKIALCYCMGQGVPEDASKAIKYFEISMAQGNIDAMVKLGEAYGENGFAETDLGKSFYYFSKAYAAGDAQAAVHLGSMYEIGNGVEKDEAKAFELYSYAASREHIGGLAAVGKCYFIGSGVEKDPDKALKIFAKIKEMDTPDSKKCVELIDELIEICDPDPKKQFNRFLKKAKNGDAESQYIVYEALRKGDGVEIDLDASREWLRKSADNGYARAQITLGIEEMIDGNMSACVHYWEMASESEYQGVKLMLAQIYLDGEKGVPVNKPRALELIKKSAEYGFDEAQVKLAEIYTEGSILPQDYNERLKWLNNASDQGNIVAKFNLGRTYFVGIGVPKDFCKAEEYYREVIASGDEDFIDEALFDLAQIFATELNDYSQAFPLWKRAAEHGHAKSEFLLSRCFSDGLGVAMDLEQALVWMRKAADSGLEEAIPLVPALEDVIRKKAAVEGKKQGLSTEKSGGCYVATSIYGSYDCPEVWTLRRFRDYILADSWYGRTFIKVYYSVSPTIVKMFGKTKWFNRILKGVLDHMVVCLRADGIENTPYEDRRF